MFVAHFRQVIGHESFYITWKIVSLLIYQSIQFNVSEKMSNSKFCTSPTGKENSSGLPNRDINTTNNRHHLVQRLAEQVDGMRANATNLSTNKLPVAIKSKPPPCSQEPQMGSISIRSESQNSIRSKGRSSIRKENQQSIGEESHHSIRVGGHNSIRKENQPSLREERQHSNREENQHSIRTESQQSIMTESQHSSSEEGSQPSTGIHSMNTSQGSKLKSIPTPVKLTTGLTEREEQGNFLLIERVKFNVEIAFAVLAKAEKIKKIKAYERKLYMDNISRKRCVQINIVHTSPLTIFSLEGMMQRKLKKKRRMRSLFSSRRS